MQPINNEITLGRYQMATITDAAFRDSSSLSEWPCPTGCRAVASAKSGGPPERAACPGLLPDRSRPGVRASRERTAPFVRLSIQFATLTIKCKSDATFFVS